MKRYIQVFDQVMTKKVGRIPVSFQPYFAWLGRFTTPLLWATTFTVTHVLLITPNRLEPSAVAIIVLLPVATLMKLFFKRQRPPTIYAAAMRVKSYSFPSSHAYSAAVAGGYLAVEAADAGFMVGATLLLVLVSVIGLSRIHVGAHYPSDVIAGWLLGIVVVASVLSFL